MSRADPEGRSAGSYSADDPDRPQWDITTELVAEFPYHREDGSYAYTALKGRRADGEKALLKGRRPPGGYGDIQSARSDPQNRFYSYPGLEAYMVGAGDYPPPLYRFPELMSELAARPNDPVCIAEGEKDTDTLRDLGFIATTNANGALNWPAECNGRFTSRDILIFVDNDDRGRERRSRLLRELGAVARSIKAIELPGLPAHGDVTDWLEGGKTREDLLAAIEEVSAASADEGVRLEDFYAFMPAHNYIFAPTGETWPSTSVNSRIQPVPLFRGVAPVLDDDGEQVSLAANRWLDQHRPVEQMTWAPGHLRLIEGQLISEGGFIARPGCNVFNLYKPPRPPAGDATLAEPWIDHVRRVYPEDAEHLINWMAHRVQRPEEKINHALVFGGAQGIGKDTILEPVKLAVGPWNCAEVSPQQMLGRFNGFLKSVLLRVSEARDLGDVDRFAFYDHLKAYTAAPPDVLRVDEKFMREYAVFNVCGLVITSNHKTNGIFLPADDRRHYVAWSELTKDDFEEGYWQRLWGWYQRGGFGHVAAYLAERDISAFEAKAPPPKTPAFWDIVASNSAPEDAELSDAIEKLGAPTAVTLTAIAEVAETSFGDWLRDRKNSRKVPHKMEECGYRAVRNPHSKSGRWKVEGKDVVIYVRRELSIRDAVIAAERRVAVGNNVPL